MQPIGSEMTQAGERSRFLHVCHVTTVHQWNDVRVFQRMASGLSRLGMQVTLVANVDEEKSVDGVRIVPTKLRGKMARLLGAPSLLPRLNRIDAQIYHFHDPELLPWMFLYQLMRPSVRVVYDVHEYFPEALMVTNFFRVPLVNRIMSVVVKHVEPMLGRRLAGVVGVTEPIAERFRGGRAQVAVVRNVVKLEAMGAAGMGHRPVSAEPKIVLGGSISADRCMEQLVGAIAALNRRGVRLELLCIGQPQPPGFGDTLRQLASDLGIAEQIHFKEKLPFSDYQQHVSDSAIGVVLYAPGMNNEMGVPNRLYEFMAHAIPVVATAFPEVAKVVKQSECGMLVDSAAPDALADAMQYLLEHEDEARAMGLRGRRAVESTYCWEREIEVLLSFYGKLTGLPPTDTVSFAEAP